MERFIGRDHIAHLITDPQKEDPEQVKMVVERALQGEGGVIIVPKGKSKRETFSSGNLKMVKDPTQEEIKRYTAAIALKILTTAQSATVFEYSTS